MRLYRTTPLLLFPLLALLMAVLPVGISGGQELTGRVSEALRLMGVVGEEEPLFDPFAGLSPAERELTRGLLVTLPPSLLSGLTMADLRRMAEGALDRSQRGARRFGVEPKPLERLFFLAYPTALDEPADWPPVREAWQELLPQAEQASLDQMRRLVTELAASRFPSEGEAPTEVPPPSSSPWPSVEQGWCPRRVALTVRLLRLAGLPARAVWTGPTKDSPRGYPFTEVLTPAGWSSLDPCGKGIASQVRESGAVYRPYPSEWALALSPYLAVVDTSSLGGFSVELATADYRDIFRTELVEVELAARGPHGEPLHQFSFSLYGAVDGRLAQMVRAQCQLGSPCRLLVPPGTYLAIWQSSEELLLSPPGRDSHSGKEEGKQEFTSLFLPLSAARRVELHSSGQRTRLAARLMRGSSKLPGRIWLREVPR